MATNGETDNATYMATIIEEATAYVDGKDTKINFTHPDVTRDIDTMITSIFKGLASVPSDGLRTAREMQESGIVASLNEPGIASLAQRLRPWLDVSDVKQRIKDNAHRRTLDQSSTEEREFTEEEKTWISASANYFVLKALKQVLENDRMTNNRRQSTTAPSRSDTVMTDGSLFSFKPPAGFNYFFSSANEKARNDANKQQELPRFLEEPDEMDCK